MSLTEREKENAIECWHEIAKRGKGMNPEMFADLFLSRVREEQEAIAEVLDNEFTCTPIWTEHGYITDTPHGTKLFTTPPAAPDCKELEEIIKQTVSAYEAQERELYTIEEERDKLLKDCSELVEALEMFVWPYQEKHRYTEAERTKIAKEAIANHAKRMKGKRE